MEGAINIVLKKRLVGVKGGRVVWGGRLSRGVCW